MSLSASGALATAQPSLLSIERDRAERLLNGVRLVVLLLLGMAALVYAPSLSIPLDVVNVSVLLPMLAWTMFQQRVYYRRPMLPEWLSLANPIVDITAVTCLLAGYGIAQSASLALKTPMFSGYFIILAALPVASSTRKARTVAALVVVEYATLVVAFLATGRLGIVLSPVAASAAQAVSPLDEGAKVLLLACAGAVATYATRWQERLSARYSQATRESEQLQTRLAQAQLQALRLQLNPHFLFNTLNTITALVHTDPHAAERMIVGLSELLRISLGSVGEQEVPLSRELEVLEHYLEIQQVRFADRLQVQYRVAPGTEGALVPNLLLQPLVENAIKHGIAPRAASARIDIAAHRSNGALTLEVSDNGTGNTHAAPAGDGLGLRNTRERLRSLYGDDYRFDAAPQHEGGYRVVIELPFHTTPVGATSDAEDGS
ncbi:MAG: histidine kinase [Gemmatimonadaceae bacterium]